MADEEQFAAAPAGSATGQRLRAAREEKGLALEDVATQTRIPRRHLEAIENGDWERLPAPTYTIGFAKSYASAVGLDRTEVGEEVRAEMGGARPSSTSAEIFEAADPARTMPRWLVLSALGAIVLVVLALSWFNNRQLTEAPPPLAEPSEDTAPADSAPQSTAAAPATSPAAASGPVVLGAAEPVWLQVYERGGATLFQGELAAGQSYQVPPGATAPLLRTGKPEALRITVGGRPVPPVGPPARTVSNVSLLGPDLLSGGAGGGPGAPAPSVPQPSAPPGIGNTAG